jgi:ParB-like chromosome segregation protein Spo0J
MQTEAIDLDKITPDPANVRKHSTKNIEAIKASLKRFGQQKPVVLDTNNVVRAGNGTYLAAQALGWTYLHCVVSDLPSADLVAFAIADNRTAELGTWDADALTEQLSSLDEELAAIAYLDFKIPDELGDDFGSSDKVEEPSNEIVVTCESEAAQEVLYKELTDRGYACKVI